MSERASTPTDSSMEAASARAPVPALTPHGFFSRSPTLNRLSLPAEPAVLILSTREGPSVRRGGKASAVGTPTSTAGDELRQPLLPAVLRADKLERKLQFAYNLSWVINIVLFAAKGLAFWISGSKAVLASLVDSFVDLVSQVVIFVAEAQSKKLDPRFPVGKARMETIGVLACACIMSVTAYEVVQDSGMSLYAGLAHGVLPELETGLIMFSVLGAATLLKLICYVVCVALQSKSDSMLALAEDHLNDIFSNVGAAVTAAIATLVEGAWWADPAGGILISLFILWRWYAIATEQVEKIVGSAAPDELVEQLRHVADTHHASMEVDSLRAYHFGSKFMVEAEVVMPIDYTLKTVHDVSLELQNKLEALDLVERAFVHVDYERRMEPEHRTERLLAGLPVVAEEPLSPV